MSKPRDVLIAIAFPGLLGVGPAAAEFKDATVGSGLFGAEPTWGAQAVDIDADGDIDVVNAHHFLSVVLFTNAGDGTFSTTGIPQIVTEVGDRHGFLWADLDGDELLDAVCSHGGGGGCGCSDDGTEVWKSLGGGILDPVIGAGGMADSVGRGRAFSAADVDGDGDLDLYHAKAPLTASPNSLYRNEGGMTFLDVAPDLGLDEIEGTVGGIFTDYDDDGDPDLLVGGEEFMRRTILWRNDGSAFADATVEAFGGELPIVAGADWGDYDNDGDVDLAVCEGADGVFDTWGVDGTEYWFFAHHRFDEDGVDAFSLESQSASPLGHLEWRGTYAPERIFLGPLGEHPTDPIFLLTDDFVGEPVFTPGVDEGLYVWRESPGGRWQIRVSAPPGTDGNYSGRIYAGGVSSPADSSLEVPALSSGRTLVYRNDGGTFTDVTIPLGFLAFVNPRGVAWVDFDNDGDLDLHLVNKGTAATVNETDVLWRNDGSSFQPLIGVGWVPGSEDHLGDGGVWADLDEDGDLDLVLQDGAGPSFFSSLAPTTFYRNDGPAGHWLAVGLGASESGGTSVGTRVACHAADRTVHRRVEANAWRGFQRPLELHFGLGDATLVDSLVIAWPWGTVEVVGPFPADTTIHVEGAVDPTAIASGGQPGPTRARVGAVVPQPARGSSAQEIRFSLSEGARVRVTVFDVAGRRVRALGEVRGRGEMSRVHWDGRDGSGAQVPAGIYFFRAEGDLRFTRKAVRLR